MDPILFACSLRQSEPAECRFFYLCTLPVSLFQRFLFPHTVSSFSPLPLLLLFAVIAIVFPILSLLAIPCYFFMIKKPVLDIDRFGLPHMCPLLEAPSLSLSPIFGIYHVTPVRAGFLSYLIPLLHCVPPPLFSLVLSRVIPVLFTNLHIHTNPDVFHHGAAYGNNGEIYKADVLFSWPITPFVVHSLATTVAVGSFVFTHVGLFPLLWCIHLFIHMFTVPQPAHMCPGIRVCLYICVLTRSWSRSFVPLTSPHNPLRLCAVGSLICLPPSPPYRTHETVS